VTPEMQQHWWVYSVSLRSSHSLWTNHLLIT